MQHLDDLMARGQSRLGGEGDHRRGRQHQQARHAGRCDPRQGAGPDDVLDPAAVVIDHRIHPGRLQRPVERAWRRRRLGVEVDADQAGQGQVCQLSALSQPGGHQGFGLLFPEHHWHAHALDPAQSGGRALGGGIGGLVGRGPHQHRG